MKKAFVIFIFILLLLPMWFMFTGSLQNSIKVMKMPPDIIPRHATMANYLAMLNWPLMKWTTNTILTTASTILLTILICSTAGYAFAFYKFRFKEALWALLLVGMMIPRISMIIPLFVIMRKLALSGTLLACILPISYYPVGLFLARTFFESIPISLLESARLDGAHEWQILFHIVMPMSRPIVTALGLFASINALQDYLWQMLVLQKEGNQTLLVGMMKAIMSRMGDRKSVV
jgi:ABC-type glycerol-3-phosphate transport system permease component